MMSPASLMSPDGTPPLGGTSRTPLSLSLSLSLSVCPQLTQCASRRYLKDRLALHGIETLTPESDDDLRQIFNLIVTELSLNVFTDETRAFFASQVRKLMERGASGVILGCTEIELLELQQELPEVLLFRSAELHIQAGARIAAGLDVTSDYEPE